MARFTMPALIARTRTLLGDVGATHVFSDDEIEAALDFRRTNVYYHRPIGIRDLTTGRLKFFIFEIDLRNWEQGVVLYDASRQLIPAEHYTVDHLNGRITFAPEHARATDWLYVSGRTYDLYQTVSDLHETWAGRIADESFDFGYAGSDFKRSQLVEFHLTQAVSARKKARGRVGRMSRRDERWR